MDGARGSSGEAAAIEPDQLPAALQYYLAHRTPAYKVADVRRLRGATGAPCADTFIIGFQRQTLCCPFAGRVHRANRMKLVYGGGGAPAGRRELVLQCYKCPGHKRLVPFGRCACGQRCCGEDDDSRWLGPGSGLGVCSLD